MHGTFPPGVLAPGGLSLDQSGTAAPMGCARLVLLPLSSLPGAAPASHRPMCCQGSRVWVLSLSYPR